MTQEKYCKLASKLLREYCELLHRSSYNDMDLEKHIPDEKERKEFAKEFYEWNYDPEFDKYEEFHHYDDTCDYKFFTDTNYASFLAYKIICKKEL